MRKILALALLLVGCSGTASLGERNARVSAPGRPPRGHLQFTEASSDDDWLRTPPPPLPLLPSQSTEVLERRLTNGVRVLLVQRDDFPSVALTFVLDRGICDGAMAAALYAHALGGSPGNTRNENFTYLHHVGVSLRWYASEDAIVAHTTVLPPLVPSALSRIVPMFLAPDLAADDLDAARRRLKKDLTLEGGLEERLAERALRRSLFGPRAYSTVLVEQEEVDGEPDRRVREFRRTALAPGHVTVIAVGDFGSTSLLQQLERFTADLPRTTAETSTCAAFPVSAERPPLEIVDRPGSEQAHVRIGAVGVPAGHADAPALAVLAAALGQSLSSRLNLRIRQEHGYTYGVRMHSREWRGHGLVEVTTRVETARAAEALKGLHTELDRASGEELDDDELLRAKLGARPSGGANDAIAGELVPVAAYGLPANAVALRAEAIRRVTAQDLVRVARTYLAPNRRVVAIVGDSARIVPKLRELGLARDP